MEPILLDIPDSFETERLFMRVPRSGDGALIYPAVVESQAQLGPWMPWAHGRLVQEDNERFARRAVASFATREQLHMLIFLRETGELVGSCGMNNINWKVPHGQIGYWLRSSHTGKGYMTEAVIGWTLSAFSMGMKRVEIRCDTRNIRSAAVAERAGFTVDGVLRSDSRGTDGQLRDTRVYSRIASA